MRRFHKFFFLPSTDRWLLIKSFIFLWAIRLGFWILSFPKVHRMVLVKIQRSAYSPYKQPAIRQVPWAVTVASRYVLKATCLTQALTVQILLAQMGIRSDLRIGIKKVTEILEAHAWVELEGKVIIGRHGMDKFIPLSSS